MVYMEIKDGYTLIIFGLLEVHLLFFHFALYELEFCQTYCSCSWLEGPAATSRLVR